MPVHRKDSRVYITGKISGRGGDLRSLCNLIDEAAATAKAARKERTITLDFCLCTRVTQTVILPLIPIIVKYRENEDFAFEFAGSNFVFDENPNWIKYITGHDADYICSADENANKFPVHRFRDENEKCDILRKINAQFYPILADSADSEVNKKNWMAIDFALNEIMDNVLRHAYPIGDSSHLGGFVQVTYDKPREYFEFVVSDAGVGISNSLTRSRSSTYHKNGGKFGRYGPLHDCLNEDWTVGWAGEHECNGKGLWVAHQIATKSKGQFQIHSMTHHLYWDQYIYNLESRQINYSGTSVRCSINIAGSVLAEEVELDDNALSDTIEDTFNALYPNLVAKGHEHEVDSKPLPEADRSLIEEASPQEAEKKTGTVLWFNSDKGYGFIVPDGGGDNDFVHYAAVESSNIDDLRSGVRIQYDLVRQSDGRFSAQRLVRERKTGTVLWFNPDKGYGFIVPDGGGDNDFVHRSAVESSDFPNLVSGDRIQYELSPKRGGGFMAVNLVPSPNC